MLYFLGFALFDKNDQKRLFDFLYVKTPYTFVKCLKSPKWRKCKKKQKTAKKFIIHPFLKTQKSQKWRSVATGVFTFKIRLCPLYVFQDVFKIQNRPQKWAFLKVNLMVCEKKAFFNSSPLFEEPHFWRVFFDISEKSTI